MEGRCIVKGGRQWMGNGKHKEWRAEDGELYKCHFLLWISSI